MSIDWQKLIRALKGRPEPDRVPSLDNLRTMIDALGKDLPDPDQSKLWFDIDQMAFRELGEVYTDTFEMGADEAAALVKAQYPTITDFKLPDSTYIFTRQEQMQKVLERDWTYRIRYIADKFDCDEFADLLKSHLSLYYGISSFTIWGDTSAGYHAFNLTILKTADNSLRARLIEPQKHEICETLGPMGTYVPRSLINNYGTYLLRDAYTRQ